METPAPKVKWFSQGCSASSNWSSDSKADFLILNQVLFQLFHILYLPNIYTVYDSQYALEFKCV